MPKTKLTPTDVKKIKESFKTGNADDLAKTFGVSKARIYQIAKDYVSPREKGDRMNVGICPITGWRMAAW